MRSYPSPTRMVNLSQMKSFQVTKLTVMINEHFSNNYHQTISKSQQLFRIETKLNEPPSSKNMKIREQQNNTNVPT